MPKTVDEEAIAKATSMDLSKPPVKEIPHNEFPRMIYKHPKDKTKEHHILIVADQAELDKALKQGYSLKPHVPVAAPEAFESAE